MYHNHSFFNQPSELCLDSKVSYHKLPPEREAKLQKAILTHEANHQNLEISCLEMTKTCSLYDTLLARDSVSIKLLVGMVLQLFKQKHFVGKYRSYSLQNYSFCKTKL